MTAPENKSSADSAAVKRDAEPRGLKPAARYGDLLPFLEAAKWMRCRQRPVLFSHAKPDGDAAGSLVAMQRLLAAQGIEACATLFDPLPDRMQIFRRLGALSVYRPEVLATADAVVILDTCTLSQLEPVAGWLRETPLPKLVVDHHLTRDSIADHYLIDERAAATCLILYEWAKAAGWPMDADTASALFIGLATDTGWFRHSNTNARALAAGGELVALGARPNELFQELYQRDSAGRLRLLGMALASLQIWGDGRLAVMHLAASSLQAAEAVVADTEDVVNEPLRIGSVQVSLFLMEQDNGLIRANLRSKAPCTPSDPDIDVAAIAALHGGGGHRRAAGVRIQGTLEHARQVLTQALLQALQDRS